MLQEEEQILYQKPEAARVLRISESTLNRLLARKAIPSVRLGRRVLITKEALEAYVSVLKAG
jgi:excisionase family DNA binding protein